MVIVDRMIGLDILNRKVATLGGFEKDNALVDCPSCGVTVRAWRLVAHNGEPECTVVRVRREYFARGWAALHATHAQWAHNAGIAQEVAPAEVVFEFGKPHEIAKKAVKERPYGPEWVTTVCNLHAPFTPAQRRALLVVIATDPDLIGTVGTLLEMKQKDALVELLKGLLRVQRVEHGKVPKHGASSSKRSTPAPQREYRSTAPHRARAR